jgi:dihydroflavonol-4-reductase
MATPTATDGVREARRPSPRFWSGRPVCVTGGTGLLGYHLVRQLLQLGARVRLFALPPAPSHPVRATPWVECVFGDVLDEGVVRRAVAGAAVVFHTAGTVSVWGPELARMRAVHETGTRNVLAAARHAVVVHTSSIFAVGATRRPIALCEDSPFELNRLGVDYVQAKRAAERVALEARPPAVVTNPGCLLGPDDYERSAMGRFCSRFWRGHVPLAPPGGLNLVDVRDVARGHLLAAEHGVPGRRYILGGENHSLRAFLELLSEAAGLRPRGLPRVPAWLLAAWARLAACRSWFTGTEPYPAIQHVRLNRYYWYASSERACAELGYAARPLRDCLRDMYRWHCTRASMSLRGLSRWWMRPAVLERAA